MGTLLLFVLAGLAGIGVGMLRGGKPRSLLQAKVHARALALALLALQAVVGSLALRSVGIPRGAGPILLFLALVGLLGDQFAVRPLRAAVSFGDVAEMAGLFLLAQALVLGSTPRAPRAEDSAHGAPEARTVPWST